MSGASLQWLLLLPSAHTSAAPRRTASSCRSFLTSSSGILLPGHLPQRPPHLCESLQLVLQPSPAVSSSLSRPPIGPVPPPPGEGGGGGGGDGDGSGRNGNNNTGWWWWGGGPSDPGDWWLSVGSFIGTAFLLLALFSSPALARFNPDAGAFIWEVTGTKQTKLALVPSRDSFMIVADTDEEEKGNGGFHSLVFFWRRCVDLVVRLMLPDGYPHTVSSDYLEYSLWRGVQGIASQMSGVLSTQALLYAVGLGKGAIPMAAAVNWVLKDGIGYLSKILLSKFGRHFDVHPKGWRLFADLLENAAYGLEILTPILPHHFVLIGAAAGASRSAAALIQAATRSCFYAGFAVQRNFAEVIAKGEAQGMVSKFLGIMLGIALGNCIGASTPLALSSYAAITGVHMYCNLKSYQSIQLRTLNPYRASLVFSEYLLSGQVPSVKEVNDEEPLFPSLPIDTACGRQSQILSSEAKDSAAEICRRLQLGSKLSDVVSTQEDVRAIFQLFRNEGYLLAENQGRFCVVLKEGSSPEDMLKSLFHVNYINWLEKNAGFERSSFASECRPGGRLHISLSYVEREFDHIKHDAQQHGWVTDGLVARPLTNRIRPGYGASNPSD